jgi:hypothetical protein
MPLNQERKRRASCGDTRRRHVLGLSKLGGLGLGESEMDINELGYSTVSSFSTTVDWISRTGKRQQRA